MSAWLEKLLFALFPVLISGIIYLFSSLSALQMEVQTVKDDARIARDQLESVMDDKIHDLDKRVGILESK